MSKCKCLRCLNHVLLYFQDSSQGIHVDVSTVGLENVPETGDSLLQQARCSEVCSKRVKFKVFDKKKSLLVNSLKKVRYLAILA